MAGKSTGDAHAQRITRSELSIRYHDEEWGRAGFDPSLVVRYDQRKVQQLVHDDRALFEFLILEGAQAGLSWETILNKREHYRTAFDPLPAPSY